MRPFPLREQVTGRGASAKISVLRRGRSRPCFSFFPGLIARLNHAIRSRRKSNPTGKPQNRKQDKGAWYFRNTAKIKPPGRGVYFFTTTFYFYLSIISTHSVQP